MKKVSIQYISKTEQNLDKLFTITTNVCSLAGPLEFYNHTRNVILTTLVQGKFDNCLSNLFCIHRPITY